MPLGEVAGHQLPALHAEQQRPAPCRARARAPTAPPAAWCRRMRRPRAARRSAWCCRTRPVITERRSAGSSRARNQEQRDLAVAHDAIGAREQERLLAERLGDAQRRPPAGPPSRRRSRAAPLPPPARPRWSATRSRSMPTTSAPRINRPWKTPSHVGCAAISAVHCVRASTNTRSKNSSSGVTRSSSRSTAVTRRERSGVVPSSGLAQLQIAQLCPAGIGPSACRCSSGSASFRFTPQTEHRPRQSCAAYDLRGHRKHERVPRPSGEVEHAGIEIGAVQLLDVAGLVDLARVHLDHGRWRRPCSACKRPPAGRRSAAATRTRRNRARHVEPGRRPCPPSTV